MTKKIVPASFTETKCAISDSTPSSADLRGYRRLRKWQPLRAICRISAYGLEGFKPLASPYANFTMTFDERHGKPAFMTSRAIFVRAMDSFKHHSIRINYPDGEEHFLDVLATGSRTRDCLDHIEYDAQFAVCRAPIVRMP